MDRNSADLTHPDNLNNGIVEVMRDVLLIGTKGIDGKVLLRNDYVFAGKREVLLMKKYEHYSVTYQKRPDNLYNLMTVAKR